MANPTAREQELLELINRMRTAPAAELAILLNSSDPDVIIALNYFQVNRTTLAAQWSLLTPVAPLAWSSQLNDAATAHNQKMIMYDQQSHQVGVSDSLGNFTAYEPDLGGRLTAANYNFTRGYENIYAYSKSIVHGNAGFAIDWGNATTGHRDNMMSTDVREVGVAVTDENIVSTSVGPLVITEDFGNRSALTGKAWLLGVAFQDTNKDSWYEAGEGLKDVQVTITGINGTTINGTTTPIVTTVTTTGGYQELLNPGQYRVDFSRNGTVFSSKTTLINADNIKIDLVVPVLTRTDFSGDKKSDILWRNDNGTVAVWQMNGATVASSSLTSTSTLVSSWKAAGTADFDGDSKSDILWRNDNGAVAVWQMNGSAVTTSTIVSTVSADWKIAGTADFDGDGKSDILWRNDNGGIALWQMNGAAVVSASATSHPTVDNSWKIAGTGDFDSDGKSDILWRNDDGSVALWQMNGAAVTAATIVSKVSADWKIAGIGDFNGDAKSDILWRNDNGGVALWQMNGAAVVSASLTSNPTVDNSWKIAGNGDFNGDGKSDIFWRNDSGATSVWQMNGSYVVSASLTSVPAIDSTWKIATSIL
jgi:hypothetical protein